VRFRDIFEYLYHFVNQPEGRSIVWFALAGRFIRLVEFIVIIFNVCIEKSYRESFGLNQRFAFTGIFVKLTS